MGTRRFRGDAAAVPRANRAAGLAIDAHTGLILWEGQTPDYALCVDALWTRSRAPDRGAPSS